MTVFQNLAWLAVAVGLAGCGRPYEHDPIEVNARYTLKYNQPCSAWLRSPRTGYLYCSSPPFKVAVMGAAAPAAPAFVSKAEGEVDEASLKAHGELVYGAICTTCHQADGKGLPGSFPPLAGSGGFYGDPQNHAKIVVHGLSGAITVQGAAFNGAMPAQAQLTDYDVAAVTTFERLSWGNNDGIVLPADVAAVR